MISGPPSIDRMVEISMKQIVEDQIARLSLLGMVFSTIQRTDNTLKIAYACKCLRQQFGLDQP